ncbi:MAG: flagellar biosynthesis protein FlgJ [Candidatus Puniceispirillum sp. TMED52]|nr:flagellar biosynthesis protein FlgJ [SAR116 cluster bacterium]OUU46643.1 MAG: flagellar biosynthesis protein FlgJ [Candidatus Puniceispirillum sp. TMED52]HCP19110.1 flagellar biosynthesis protein FlgJ [Alphaproteobacteria bacterium]
MIDPASQNQLNTILQKLGVNKNEEEKANKDQLGQEDFLKLMTTQLQNQDPFAPMENAEFIAQMAQFSTVTGITEMGESLKSLSSQIKEFRVATASSLMGASVMVPGNVARPDSNGEIHGMIDLPSSSTMTQLTFSDATGTPIHSMDLGPQASGLTGFAWEDIPADIVNSEAPLRVDVFADFGNGMENLTPSVFAEVFSTSVGDDSDGVMLDVRDYGQVRAADVLRFRKAGAPASETL